MRGRWMCDAEVVDKTEEREKSKKPEDAVYTKDQG